MLTIKICNDGTGNKEIGNYKYEVQVNYKTIEEGTIEGHKRKEGWRKLVKLLIGDENE